MNGISGPIVLHKTPKTITITKINPILSMKCITNWSFKKLFKNYINLEPKFQDANVGSLHEEIT